MLVSLAGAFLWSAIHPFNLLIWCFEALPALFVLSIFLFTYRRFKFTNLTYFLLWIAGILVAIGGHYAYENVPLFDWIRDIFHLHRNHYDRFVHFWQGMTTAMVMRELFIRKSPLTKGFWLFIVVISMSLSYSALYELGEFVIAKITGKAAEEFLGLQGDVWDTQWDMLFGVTGALVALLLFSAYQNRLIIRKTVK